MDCNQAGNAAALHIFTTHRVARALGRDHDDVDIRWRFNQAEMNVEAMRKGKRRTRLHIALQIIVPNCSLMLIGGEDHDDIGPSSGFCV
jgi:hypothetical protein